MALVQVDPLALPRILKYARLRIPFYRRRFSESGIGPDPVSIDEMAKLAPIERSDIKRESMSGLLPETADVAAALAEGRISLATTSGSSDERLQVYSVRGSGALRDDAHSFFGVDLGASLRTGAILTSPTCSAVACGLGEASMLERTSEDSLTLNSSRDLMSISEAEVRNIVEELQEFAPSVFFVHPWYAVVVGLRARALGLRLHSPDLILSSFQTLTLRHRRLLTQLFDAPVRSVYSATELGGYVSASECGRGNLHVRPDNVYVELEPLDSRPRLGGLLITTLRNPWMPLLRYRIGDVAEFRTCDCPHSNGEQIIRIHGRMRDMLSAADGRAISTVEVDDVVGPDELDFYRLIQHRASRFELQVMEARSGGADRVRARLVDLLGAVEIRVAHVRHFSPERSLKFRQTYRAQFA